MRDDSNKITECFSVDGHEPLKRKIDVKDRRENFMNIPFGKCILYTNRLS